MLVISRKAHNVYGALHPVQAILINQRKAILNARKKSSGLAAPGKMINRGTVASCILGLPAGCIESEYVSFNNICGKLRMGISQ